APPGRPAFRGPAQRRLPGQGNDHDQGPRSRRRKEAVLRHHRRRPGTGRRGSGEQELIRGRSTSKRKGRTDWFALFSPWLQFWFEAQSRLFVVATATASRPIGRL